jgi:hypothetical protein
MEVVRRDHSGETAMPARAQETLDNASALLLHVSLRDAVVLAMRIGVPVGSAPYVLFVDVPTLRHVVVAESMVVSRDVIDIYYGPFGGWVRLRRATADVIEEVRRFWCGSPQDPRVKELGRSLRHV